MPKTRLLSHLITLLVANLALIITISTAVFVLRIPYPSRHIAFITRSQLREMI